MKDLAGKVAVITGAGSGFGREFARLGARLGCKLVLADVQQDALTAIHDELTAQGAEVLAQRTNVASSSEVEALAVAAMERFAAVHLLFNNAGVGSGGRLWECSLADWEWVLGVNLWGVVHGIRSFIPRMIELGKADPSYRGYVVNTSSVSGLLSPSNMGIYSASKHAVVTISETLYHDLHNAGAPIGVSVLCPAFVPTGIAESHRNRPTEYKNAAPATSSQKVAQEMTRKAVESGKISAAIVAEQTFAAIAEDRFYILTHPNIIPSVTARLTEIAEQRNPTDPLTHQRVASRDPKTPGSS